jgi:hypothetical protein
MLTLLSLLLVVTDSRDTEIQTGAIKHTFDPFKNLRLTDGFGIGEADRAFSDRRTLAASANEDLDLAGGFTDPFGSSATMAKVKLLVIYNRSTTQSLMVKSAATNGALLGFGATAHSRTISPGSFEVYYNPVGWAITAGTADLINVANGAGASADYDIYGVGTSA